MSNENYHDNTKTRRLIIAEWAMFISVFWCFIFLFYRIEKQSERSDAIQAHFHDNISKQAERTDKLYEMFIDLIKEKRNQSSKDS